MVKKNNKTKLKDILIKLVLPLAVAVIAGTGITIAINSNQVTVETDATTSTIDLSEEQAPATVTLGEEAIEGIETGQGAIGEEAKVENEIPTVEAVESNGPVTEVNDESCPEGEECGQGAYVPTLDISSPQAFANQTLGVCLDVDGYYGAQCWDSMAAFFINYTGHTLYTCGTGAAKGTIAEGCWQQNAGDQFTMIWDPTQIQAGDIAVYSTGQWGHIGMAMGDYNNGYFTLLGQNQGGAACPGGGAAGNIINLSTRDFIGAFRPNIYIKPTPAPEPAPEPEPAPVPVPVVDVCKVRTVAKGETMGSIMQECRGEIVWGAAMDEYAQHWYSTIVNPGNTVFYGWTHDTGYGLFYDDVIKYKD